jgi:hypothetical protein
MTTLDQYERANRERDRRLRRYLLNVLHAGRNGLNGGELGGEFLRDCVNGTLAPGQTFEDDNHVISLLRDLVNKGLAEERTLQRRRGEGFYLRHVVAKVTAKGSSLINETIPPDPDIDDERIVSE